MNPIVKALNFVRSYTMRPPKWVNVSIAMVPFLIALYWMLTESGWYMRIAQWQASSGDGSFSPVLCFLLPVLVMLLMAIPVMVLIGMFFPEKHPDETNMKKGLF